ncbi:hypothetical protein SESBI_02838 [Sesbania bispinosa]|nr:hypothetical protein SESBI_02838 [Sesbania bispinosa]
MPCIIYDEENVFEGVNSCLKSLVGKILTEKQKPIHVNRLQNALVGIWCNPKDFKVEDIAPKTFQFFFKDDQDVDHILADLEKGGKEIKT